MHRDFDFTELRMDTISIIFPQIEYSIRYAAEEKNKTGYSMFVSNNVSEALKEVVDDRKTFLQSAVVLADTLILQQWIRSYFSHSKDRFMQKWDSSSNAPDGNRKFPATPEMQLMISNINTRYFLFATGDAYGTSEEKKQFDALQAQTFELFYDHAFAYNYQWHGIQLNLFIVDAKSGEVIWYNHNRSSDTKYNPFDKKEIKNLCWKLLEGE
jgi:hypothetical protein